MDGPEVFRRIRESSLLNRDTPVVILTGNAGEDCERKYALMDFDGYLSKPVLKEDLIAVIHEILEN